MGLSGCKQHKGNGGPGGGRTSPVYPHKGNDAPGLTHPTCIHVKISYVQNILVVMKSY